MLSVASFFYPVLDWLLPPLCVSCAEPVESHQALCPSCWKTMTFAAPPLCACCGMPFGVPVEGDALCPECLTHPPAYHRARSAMIYDDASKRLVLNLKHGDQLHHVPALAAWMHRVGAVFWSEADVIVPVPLHRWRLFRRRYNQAALLAQALGCLTQKKVLVDALQRVRSTPSQGTMNRQERKKNVAGAFRLNPRYEAMLKGKNVILIDDVLTTGATVNECSRILIEVGASQVEVLTLMRTRSRE